MREIMQGEKNGLIETLLLPGGRAVAARAMQHSRAVVMSGDLNQQRGLDHPTFGSRASAPEIIS